MTWAKVVRSSREVQVRGEKPTLDVLFDTGNCLIKIRHTDQDGSGIVLWEEEAADDPGVGREEI